MGEKGNGAAAAAPAGREDTAGAGKRDPEGPPSLVAPRRPDPEELAEDERVSEHQLREDLEGEVENGGMTRPEADEYLRCFERARASAKPW